MQPLQAQARRRATLVAGAFQPRRWQDECRIAQPFFRRVESTGWSAGTGKSLLPIRPRFLSTLNPHLSTALVGSEGFEPPTNSV